jgi:hypothetical protein
MRDAEEPLGFFRRVSGASGYLVGGKTHLVMAGTTRRDRHEFWRPSKVDTTARYTLHRRALSGQNQLPILPFLGFRRLPRKTSLIVARLRFRERAVNAGSSNRQSGPWGPTESGARPWLVSFQSSLAKSPRKRIGSVPPPRSARYSRTTFKCCRTSSNRKRRSLYLPL